MPRTSARRSRRQFLRLGAGALGAALFAACGGDGESEPATRGPVIVKVPLRSSYPGEDGTTGGVLRLGRWAMTGAPRRFVR